MLGYNSFTWVSTNFSIISQNSSSVKNTTHEAVRLGLIYLCHQPQNTVLLIWTKIRVQCERPIPPQEISTTLDLHGQSSLAWLPSSLGNELCKPSFSRNLQNAMCNPHMHQQRVYSGPARGLPRSLQMWPFAFMRLECHQTCDSTVLYHPDSTSPAELPASWTSSDRRTDQPAQHPGKRAIWWIKLIKEHQPSNSPVSDSRGDSEQ